MPERLTGLARELGAVRQGMIAIGGIVGVGLFLGSGATIGLAGPAVIIAYLLAAVVAIPLGLVIAEMATVHPVAGAFGKYADIYVGRWLGFATRLSYWFAEMFAIGAMVTAVAVYLGFWFPDTPGAVFIVGAAVIAVALNTQGVGRFGLLESGFSTIKVGAILVFVVLGAALILGGGTNAWGNLLDHGGILPNGLSGIVLSLTLVVASFLGVEAVAVTAAEAERPERSVPRAVLGLVGTLCVLYVASMFVIVSVLPWTEVAEADGSLSTSPFVTVFARSGVPYSADLMNLVVVSAALTGAVSHLYLSSRVLHSLAEEGYAPQSLATVDDRGVPMRALAGSTVGLALAAALASFGTRAFLPLYGTGVVALLAIWLTIFYCHFRFRRALSATDLAALPIRVPAHPWPSLAASAVIIVAIGATPWVPGLQWTVPTFAAWLALLAVVYRLGGWREKARASAHRSS